MPLQRVQPALPEFSVALEPGRGPAERPRVEAAVVLPADHRPVDEPGPLEDLHVLRDGVEGHRKRPGDLGDGGRPPAEGVQDRAPGGVGHRHEDPAEGVGMTINHTVE